MEEKSWFLGGLFIIAMLMWGLYPSLLLMALLNNSRFRWILLRCSKEMIIWAWSRCCEPPISTAGLTSNSFGNKFLSFVLFPFKSFDKFPHVMADVRDNFLEHVEHWVVLAQHSSVRVNSQKETRETKSLLLWLFLLTLRNNHMSPSSHYHISFKEKI